MSSPIDCVGIKEVMQATGMSQSTLYEYIASGRFPAPLKLGKKNTWRIKRIEEWMKKQEARVDAAANGQLSKAG